MDKKLVPDKGKQGFHQGTHICTCPAWETLAQSKPLPGTVLSAEHCVTFTRASGLPQSIEIDQGPGKQFRRDFIWAPAAAVGWFLLLAHYPRGVGQAGFLYGVRGGASPRVRLQGVLGGLPASLVVLSAGACVVSCFCSWLFRSGFLVFVYLVVQNLPQLCMHTVSFSP